jgi:hypothetical protein
VASREERNARNESLFREVNERFEQGTVSERTKMLTLLCECGDVACTQVVELPLTTYEDVRREGEWFLLIAGHEQPELETVVAQVSDVLVVQKRGEGGDVARDLDPRS